MRYQLHPEFFGDLPFDIINHIVKHHNVAVRINFDMNRREDFPRAIVVDDQIMDPEHAFKGKRQVRNAAYQLGGRGFSKERADRFAYQRNAGPDDKQCYQASHISVKLPA